MHKRFLWLAIFLMITASVSAHPGIGIVMDSRGNVFYTDLKHVWKNCVGWNQVHLWRRT